ncbi:phage holin family protein [Erwinia tracheiphila]|uniref:Holin n=1 Tax=Erwinia tracheiphila TaxID=65700 RepID=A0A0M2KEB8_9GAMM|nr:phage holin family protein [Erwinia tracheiphila]EOS92916.1 phage holin [Erwinia tracheiphila PSU-1]KKF35662.1 holin [Erwinia tracheiphila]
MEKHGIIEQTMKWLAVYLPSVYAGLTALNISALALNISALALNISALALNISALIDIRDGKPKIYTATGSLACGIFALTVSAMMEYLGLPANAGAFVGGMIDFIGAD